MPNKKTTPAPPRTRLVAKSKPPQQPQNGDGDGRDEDVVPVAQNVQLRCSTCEQQYGQVDKDSKTSELLVWHKFNTSVGGVRKPCGSECYPCFARRRKYEKKGASQNDVNTAMAADPGKKDEVLDQRRSYVAGEKWNKVEHGQQSTSVVQSEANFKEATVEGFFYFLADYATMLDPDSEKKIRALSTSKLCAYVKQRWPRVRILCDQQGNYGVKEGNLPQYAAYKYREGVHSKSEFKNVSVFSEDEGEEAKDAFQELDEAKAVATGEDSESAVASGDDGDDGDGGDHGRGIGVGAELPSLFAMRNSQTSASAASKRQHLMGTPTARGASSPAPSQVDSCRSRSRHSSPPPRPPQQSQLPRPASRELSPVPVDQEKDKENTTFTKLRAQVRSNNVDKVVPAVEDMLSHTMGKWGSQRSSCNRPPPTQITMRTMRRLPTE